MTLEEYKKIISDAIIKEEESYLFYTDVAKESKDKNISSIFENLAKDELSHKALLEGYLSDSAKSFKFDTTADYKIAESLDTPNLSIDMKPADAITLAMKKEEDAMNLYTEFANLSTDEEQKKVFLNLARMEQGHKTKLEDLYVGMAFVEVW